jgi:hypothetical protein
MNRRPTTPTPRRSRVANDCIDAVLRGDLSGAREIARRNVGRCDGLAAELRSIRQSLDELRALPESPDLSDRILGALDRSAREQSRSTWRLSISRRFSVAAGLVIVSVVAGLFNRVDNNDAIVRNSQATLQTISPESGDESPLRLGDISDYVSIAHMDDVVLGGSGGVLAWVPQTDEQLTTYRGPLSSSQAVLSVKSKSRTPTAKPSRK